jgi:hypothetical protein
MLDTDGYRLAIPRARPHLAVLLNLHRCVTAERAGFDLVAGHFIALPISAAARVMARRVAAQGSAGKNPLLFYPAKQRLFYLLSATAAA